MTTTADVRKLHDAIHSDTDMAEQKRPQLLIPEDDLVLLDRCVASALATRHAPEAEALEVELARASIVSRGEVPADVVTMGSRVLIEDALAKRREVTLVYPDEADAARGKVSVLAPIGAAILGLRVGAQIAWSLPNSRVTRLRVVAIVSQAGGGS